LSRKEKSKDQMMGTTWGKKTEFVYEMMWLDKNFTLHNKNTHWKDFYFAYDHNVLVTIHENFSR